MKNKCNLIALSDPKSFVAESYKMIRTNINYSSADKKSKVLMMTSSIPEEGKTTTICNLAVIMAQENKKVLLIDCDLRKPKMHELFGIKQSPGLTNFIYDNLAFDKTIQRIKDIDGLDIMTSGVLPLSASEFLSSEIYKKTLYEFKDVYDIILIDTPPVLSVTDAMIVAQLVDGVLVVVAANQTKKTEISKTQKLLNTVNANILGVIITKVERKKNNLYYNHNYFSDNKRKKLRSLFSLKK